MTPSISNNAGARGHSRASIRERSRARRRLRYLERLREVQLRDLGGLVFELHRLGSDRRRLIDEKVAALEVTDREIDTLRRVLGDETHVLELREAGIGGTCVSCGAVHGSDDRYCARCGTPIGAEVPA